MTLTREQIMSMSAGRELDHLVAEHVMGWHVGDSWGGSYWVDSENCSRYEIVNFKPSEYINIAWEVVEKLRKTHKVEMWHEPENDDYDPFTIRITNPVTGVVQTIGEESAPLAIAKSALLTLIKEG